MHYWGSNETVTRGGRSRAARRGAARGRDGLPAGGGGKDRARTARRNAARRGSTPGASRRQGSKRAPAVTSGGSVAPFLRRFYHQQPTIPSSLQKVLFFLGISALIYAFVLGQSGAIRIAILHRDRARLNRRIAHLEATRAVLAREVNALRNDPLAIETVGREKFGMVKPGEKVYRFVPPSNEKR